MKNKKLASVIGHFSFKKELANGQTIKTKIISSTLEQQIGVSELLKFDTHGGFKALFKLPYQAIYALKNSKNIIVLPANRGIKIIVPVLLIFNKFFHRKIHYVVIGGWLPDLCRKHRSIVSMLRRVDYVYVETISMKNSLNSQKINNVVYMPNFKNISPLAKKDVQNHDRFPRSLCTFSRVMKEKGIEYAVDAVRQINNKNGRTLYRLDIYGEIDKNQIQWFKKLEEGFPDYIEYKGSVSYEKTVEVLSNYYALVFPTYYEGEGFAGTLIDSMAAGVPIVASDWKYNEEIVNEKNGVLFSAKDLNSLVLAIESMRVSRYDCLEEANKYKPDIVIQTLLERFSY